MKTSQLSIGSYLFIHASVNDQIIRAWSLSPTQMSIIAGAERRSCKRKFENRTV